MKAQCGSCRYIVRADGPDATYFDGGRCPACGSGLEEARITWCVPAFIALAIWAVALVMLISFV